MSTVNNNTFIRFEKYSEKDAVFGVFVEIRKKQLTLVSQMESALQYLLKLICV